MPIPYPIKPWAEGQTFTYQLNSGEGVTGTYNLAKNAWTMSTLVSTSRAPIFADNGPSTYSDLGDLETGDIWYDTSDSAKRYIWDGSAWVFYPDTAVNVDLSNYTTSQDFTDLTETVTSAVNQVAADVANKATQQDVALAATTVDAKFDMLRSAILEATDFDTLKARLLAVLE